VAVTESSAFTDARRPVAQALRDDVDGNVVWLRGEHDASTSAADAQTLAHAISLDDADLTVDLSDVRFMDGSTIRTLIKAHAFLDARSRSLKLRSPSPSAALVIRASGLEGFMDVRSNPSERFKSMTPPWAAAATVVNQ
jgi:anti-anti-sigma factor